MKIRITKCRNPGYWYKDAIGMEVSVAKCHATTYETASGHHIDKCDAEVIDPPQARDCNLCCHSRGDFSDCTISGCVPQTHDKWQPKPESPGCSTKGHPGGDCDQATGVNGCKRMHFHDACDPVDCPLHTCSTCESEYKRKFEPRSVRVGLNANTLDDLRKIHSYIGSLPRHIAQSAYDELSERLKAHGIET